MRTTTLAVLFTIVALGSGCGKKDDQKVQGTWTISNLDFPESEGKGGEFVKEMVKDVEVTISGDQITITSKGESKPGKLRYTYDSGKSPKTVDITEVLEGDKKPDTGLGIYKLEGDTIVLAVSFGKGKDGAAPRPTEFKASMEKKGTPDEYGVVVVTLTRKK